MEVNIQTTFHPETDPEGNAFNIIAEIPGSDLAGEVVIMGAHFDTYPYATGATDNTTGSAAMIEALRVIQKLGLKPRRTIRLALWAAEEQGLLGSRAYVARHFFDTKMKTPKPGHENVQAYFNLDNGTGRILGIWGQNNTGAMKNFEQWGQALKDIGWKNVSPRSVIADRSRIVRGSRHPRLPVHPGAARIQLAHPPLEHGHLRPRAERRCDPAGRGGGGVRLVCGEYAGEAAAQTDRSAIAAPESLKATRPCSDVSERRVLKQRTPFPSQLSFSLSSNPWNCTR